MTHTSAVPDHWSRLDAASTSVRDHARAAIAAGFQVFALSSTKKPLKNCGPCDTSCTTPEQKEACPHVGCHAFYSATSDMDVVDAMFAAHPDRCLAIRTGAVSGVMVVDVDGPEGIATMQSLISDGLLPRTRTVRTGSGYHLYYAHGGGTVMSGAGKVGHKVDSKADGAYVVAPPSLHKSGRRYTWVDWSAPIADPHPDLVARLRPPAAEPRRPVGLGTREKNYARMKGLITTVLEAQEGNGNNCLFWAACKAGEMVARGEVNEDQAHAALFEAAMAIGIKPGDAGRDPHHGTIGSGLRRGQR